MKRYVAAIAVFFVIVFGENITGEITYSSTMCSRAQGDTLALLVKVPLGRVIIR
jgi:hypothetical protein